MPCSVGNGGTLRNIQTIYSDGFKAFRAELPQQGLSLTIGDVAASDAVTQSTRAAACQRDRISREVFELLNRHLDPMLQTGPPVIKNVQVHADPFTTG